MGRADATPNHRTDPPRAAPPGGLLLFYDGQCPLCRREIEWLRRFDRRGRLALVDISRGEFDPSEFGFSRETLDAELHGILPDGRVVRRIEAVHEAYRAVGLGWLVAPLRLPGVRRMADIAYGWFARHRLAIGRWLTGRAGCEGACTVVRPGRAPERP